MERGACNGGERRTTGLRRERPGSRCRRIWPTAPARSAPPRPPPPPPPPGAGPRPCRTPCLRGPSRRTWRCAPGAAGARLSAAATPLRMMPRTFAGNCAGTYDDVEPEKLKKCLQFAMYATLRLGFESVMWCRGRLLDTARDAHRARARNRRMNRPVRHAAELVASGLP